MPTYVHGINIDAHLEILFATPRGQKGNEDGYNKIPRVKVIRRSAGRRYNRYGVAWWGRYGRPGNKHHILLNEIPGHDGFLVIETLCHEVAHLLAPRRSGHGLGWKVCFKTLIEQAYGINIPYREFRRFIGVLAPKLRERAQQGTLGVAV